MNIIKGTTPRGFQIWTFKDFYGQKCSIQESSLASENALWIGVDNTGPNIEGPSGFTNEDVNFRMHLTYDQVNHLIENLKTLMDKTLNE